ncbi:MAG: hypothetical protein VST68_13610 [Nitrospirota bacterium]|nr:hypothetical protein [Nitrospirota bacterium]
MGLLNITLTWPIQALDAIDSGSRREWSKMSVQQGRSQFDARSVLSVREHGKLGRTPLAAFFNIPMHDKRRILTRVKLGTQGGKMN